MMKKITKAMMIAQGVLWLALCIKALTARSPAPLIVAILMALDGLAFIALAFLLGKSRVFNLLTLTFLLMNLVLTITDQAGLIDYIVLGLTLVTLASFVVFLAGFKRQRGRA